MGSLGGPDFSSSAPGTVEVFIPTISRPSLRRTLDSIEQQTFKDFEVRVVDGQTSFLDKTVQMTRESKADFVAICDDDAVFPPTWLESLLVYFDMPNVGFVGGPMIPLLTNSSSRTERAAAFATSSFFGSLWMARRAKEGDIAEERTETGLVGVGVYRTRLLSNILEEGKDDIPGGAWETYTFTRMRELGFKTIFVPQGRFYHAPRTTFGQLARQAFRSGVGRMAVFRSKPSLALRAGSIILPILGLAYLIEASSHAFYWPIVVYLGLTFVAGGFNPWNLAAILTVHASYTVGLLVGLFRRHVPWT
jgi:cellulose synthase/poly-beta-1,6-N-acetylglucosamine synthase-like glycosyltransferase